VQIKIQAAIRNISLSEFDFEQQVTYLKLKNKNSEPKKFLVCSTSWILFEALNKTVDSGLSD
jgi:hypothetical protein